MLDPVKNFLFEKFWLPILDESVYYNPYNTAVYAILFGLLIIYVVRPAIKKIDIEVDKNFVLGFTPFIVFGGALRTLKDIDAVNTIFLETPFIYLLLFGTGLSLLYTSKKLEQRTEVSYHRILAASGVILTVLTLPLFQIRQPLAMILFLGITTLWITVGYLSLRYVKPEFMRWDFTLPVSAHYLDATSTLTALQFGADEKHVLGRIFIDIFGNGGMFILKSLVIIPVVVYIVRNFEGEEKTFYIFIITLLGLGIATRNILQTIGLG